MLRFLFVLCLATGLTACCSDTANPNQAAYVQPVQFAPPAAASPCAPPAAASPCQPQAAASPCAPQPMTATFVSMDPCMAAAASQGRALAVRQRVGAAEYGRAAISFPPKVAVCLVDAGGKIIQNAVDGLRCSLSALVEMFNPTPSTSLVIVQAPPAAAAQPCAPPPAAASPCAPPPTAAPPCQPIPAPTPK